MSATTPQHQDRSRHLTAVGPIDDARDAMQDVSSTLADVTRLAVEYATVEVKPTLNRAGALRLDQAELFLLSLDTEMLTADGLRAAYLLGLAEIHLGNLIELVRAVAS